MNPFLSGGYDDRYLLQDSPEVLELIPSNRWIAALNATITRSFGKGFETNILLDKKGIYTEETLYYRQRVIKLPCFSVLRSTTFTSTENYTKTFPYTLARQEALRICDVQLEWFRYAKECVESVITDLQTQIDTLNQYQTWKLGTYTSVTGLLTDYKTHLNSKLTILNNDIAKLEDNYDHINNLTGTGNTTPSTLFISTPYIVQSNPTTYATTLNYQMMYQGVTYRFGPFRRSTTIRIPRQWRYLSLLGLSWRKVRDYASSDPQAKKDYLSFPGLVVAWQKTLDNLIYSSTSVSGSTTSKWLARLFSYRKDQETYETVADLNTPALSVLEGYSSKHEVGMLVDPSGTRTKSPLSRYGWFDLETYHEIVGSFEDYPTTGSVVNLPAESLIQQGRTELFDLLVYNYDQNASSYSYLEEPTPSITTSYGEEQFAVIQSLDNRTLQPTSMSREATTKLITFNDALIELKGYPKEDLQGDPRVPAIPNVLHDTYWSYAPPTSRETEAYPMNVTTSGTSTLSQGIQYHPGNYIPTGRYFPSTVDITPQLRDANAKGFVTIPKYRRGWKVFLGGGESYTYLYSSSFNTVHPGDWQVYYYTPATLIYYRHGLKITSDSFVNTPLSGSSFPYQEWYWFGQDPIGQPTFLIPIKQRRDTEQTYKQQQSYNSDYSDPFEDITTITTASEEHIIWFVVKGHSPSKQPIEYWSEDTTISLSGVHPYNYEWRLEGAYVDPYYFTPFTASAFYPSYDYTPYTAEEVLE